MRLVMMGTGRFAMPTFRALLGSSHSVIALFTQPDRSGRGHHQHVNPLKQLAEEMRPPIPVFQPANVNLPESLAQLRLLEGDLYIVAAYGQILSPELLGIPRKGAINVHASLLPKFRGAAPVQTAILNGETETGVTLFQIEPKLDAGPILAMEKTPIGAKETSGELEARLAEIGAAMTLRVLGQIETGTTTPLIQDSSSVTRAPRLKKDSGRIDWRRSCREIDCQVRGMQPWPLAYSTLLRPAHENHKARPPLRLILLDVNPARFPSPSSVEPGTVLAADSGGVLVQAGDGPLQIARLRPEGKRDMSAAEFVRGYDVRPGDRFEAT